MSNGAPDVEILRVEPSLENALAYGPLPSSPLHPSGGAKIAVTLALENREDSAIRLVEARFEFAAPPLVPPIVYDLTDENLVINASSIARELHLQESGDNEIITIDEFPPPASVEIHLTFEDFDEPVMISRELVPYRNATPQGSYCFPFRAADLEPDEYVGGSSPGVKTHHSGAGRFVHDMKVRRWNPVKEKWQTKHFDDDGDPLSGEDNENHVSFGKPVYAVGDAVVENLEDGHPDDNSEPGGGAAGNFVHLRVGNELIRYQHLQQGSINQDLAIGDPVAQGTFLGRVGNSGRSGSPHIHFGVRWDDAELDEQYLRPILFRNLVSANQLDLPGPPLDAEAPWFPIDGHVLPIAVGGSFKAVNFPAREPRRRIEKLGTSGDTAELADETRLVRLRSNRIVSASRHGDELTFILWRVSSGGDFTRLDDSGGQVGSGSLVDVARLDEERFVAAVRTAQGNLKLIAWSVANDEVTRLSDSGNQAGNADRLAATVVDDIVATAARTAEGNLKVITWQVTDDGIERVAGSGDDAGAAVVSLDVATTGPPGHVVTASRRTDGELELAGWDVSGGEVRLVDTALEPLELANGSMVSIAPLGDKSLAVTTTGGNGKLRIFRWRLSSGGSFVRLDAGGAVAGRTDLLATSSRRFDHRLVTAVRTKAGRHKVILWSVSHCGLARLGDGGVGAGDEHLVDVVFTRKNRFVSAKPTAQGRLRLVAWSVSKDES